jgi:hypothetical protein
VITDGDTNKRRRTSNDERDAVDDDDDDDGKTRLIRVLKFCVCVGCAEIGRS